jgi:hypothetical protein
LIAWRGGEWREEEQGGRERGREGGRKGGREGETASIVSSLRE